MLLDELLAERERVQTPPTPVPVPVLSVDPVTIPPTLETGRRAVRQRLADLESAAVRNYRSAEEARRVLADEHTRLEQELTARTHAQQEAAALRRELERLNTEETRRAAQERAKAERTARAEIAGELQRFHEEHERVVHEVTVLRGALAEHDGLLDEYVTRLRDEQGARAALRAELERAEAARSLAERSLQRATENARHGAEDEMIRLATAEQQLADACSDRDRLSARLTELTSGDGAIAKMTAQLEEKDAEISSLGVRIADLNARIDASEEATRIALAEREDAREERSVAETRLNEAETARAGAERAAEVAAERIAALESELVEQTDAVDARAREIDRTLGKLRREARDASNARRTAEGDTATAEAEREELRARVAGLEAESERARADGDRLRAHAVMLGDELAAARATVAQLQAAASAAAPAPAPVVELAPRAAPEPDAVSAPADRTSAPDTPRETTHGESSNDSSERVASTHEESSNDSSERVASTHEESSNDSSQRDSAGHGDGSVPEHPPLPLRIAGRHAPAPQLARRRPRRDPAVASAAPAPKHEPGTSIAPPWAAALEIEPRAEAEVAEAPAEETEPVEPAAPAPTPRPVVSEDTFRRTAFAEFTALASSSGDDFSFRRR